MPRLSQLVTAEKSETQKAYQKFFKDKLSDYGVSSPSELSEEDKKKFFDEVSNEWKGKGKKEENSGPAKNEAAFLQDEEGDLYVISAEADKIIVAAELSIDGYLKGVAKALRKWMRKDISDDDKAKCKELLKSLK